MEQNRKELQELMEELRRLRTLGDALLFLSEFGNSQALWDQLEPYEVSAMTGQQLLQLSFSVLALEVSRQLAEDDITIADLYRENQAWQERTQTAENRASILTQLIERRPCRQHPPNTEEKCTLM